MNRIIPPVPILEYSTRPIRSPWRRLARARARLVVRVLVDFILGGRRRFQRIAA
jgi:hypothetical protein